MKGHIPGATSPIVFTLPSNVEGTKSVVFPVEFWRDVPALISSDFETSAKGGFTEDRSLGNFIGAIDWSDGGTGVLGGVARD